MKKVSHSFLAIDLGATSGRAILGILDKNHLELKEINRFQNPIVEINGRMYWNLLHLYNEIIHSLKQVKLDAINILSLGIDTWGVDFVEFGKDGEPLRMPYSYRDSKTIGAPERFFELIPKEEVYRRTGNQIMNINSLFQLFTQKTSDSSVYPAIDKILFMPDALSYLLTGKMITEYTIASTSQILNPIEKKLDDDLLHAIGLTQENFAPIVHSGTEIGKISKSVTKICGLDEIPVIAVAGHDTASAVLAIPAKNKNFAFLSSGTWSLIGIEVENPIINDETYTLNFTNEGGAFGTTRLLKNMCGLWMIEQCKLEWEKERPVSYDEIVVEVQYSTPFRSFVNPDSPCFVSPQSMISAIQRYCTQTNQAIPKTMGEIARCIYESLAFKYKKELANLEKLADFPIETLHIIGGGSKNKLLNSLTANTTGILVVAGPSEATAMGNILLQAHAAGLVKGKDEIRKIVYNSVELEHFEPENPETWNEHYNAFLEVYNDFEAFEY